MCTFNGPIIECVHSIANTYWMCTFNSLAIECVHSTAIIIECEYDAFVGSALCFAFYIFDTSVLNNW